MSRKDRLTATIREARGNSLTQFDWVVEEMTTSEAPMWGAKYTVLAEVEPGEEGDWTTPGTGPQLQNAELRNIQVWSDPQADDYHPATPEEAEIVTDHFWREEYRSEMLLEKATKSREGDIDSARTYPY